MKEKTKKWLVTAGLAVVCIGLIFGISRVLYREPVTEARMSEQETEETKVTVEMDNPDTPQTETAEPDTEEPLVIEVGVEPENAVDDRKQEIQPDPEKTEDEKPSEAPALAEGTDTGNPDTPPAYEETKEPEQQPSAESSSPKTGDIKDGMMYVEGFGWVPYEGGGGEGTYAGDMYENGNKIGIMD